MSNLKVAGSPPLLILLGLALFGCAPAPEDGEPEAEEGPDAVIIEESAEGDGRTTTEPAPDSEELEAPDAPQSLIGEWVEEAGSNSRQVAGISETSIVVRWTLDDGLSGLYWAGTFEPPTEAGGFTWTSQVYEELTEGAILASGLDEKAFTYESGLLIYEVSYGGVTEEIRLEQISSKVPEFVREAEAEQETPRD